MMGQIYVSSLGISGFRVFRVPEFNTRITRINFGYRGLLPKILIGFFEFGFFGYGFRVSGNMPSHSHDSRTHRVALGVAKDLRF